MLRRVTAALLFAATVVLATAAPASAHTSLKSSNPAKGATLPVAPQQIQLTFSENVQVEPGAITVTGPNGTQWTVGAHAVAGPVVTAPVTPAGPAGQYTINYRVISADGDPVRGTVAFTIAEAVPVPTTTTTTTTTSTTTPPPTTTSQSQPTPAAQESNSGGGVPAWIWIIGAIVVLSVAVIVVVRRRRA